MILERVHISFILLLLLLPFTSQLFLLPPNHPPPPPNLHSFIYCLLWFLPSCSSFSLFASNFFLLLACPGFVVYLEIDQYPEAIPHLRCLPLTGPDPSTPTIRAARLSTKIPSTHLPPIRRINSSATTRVTATTTITAPLPHPLHKIIIIIIIINLITAPINTIPSPRWVTLHNGLPAQAQAMLWLCIPLRASLLLHLIH